MNIDIRSASNSVTGKKQLPSQFAEELRPDLVKRAVEAIRSNNRQPYGANPRAGLRHSAELSRRRRKYKTSYGYGISRVPRKIMNRRGTRFSWVGAVAPGTVGGRRAHPPKAEKSWKKSINIQERRKAIRSALAATMIKEVVKQRGHVIPDTYPFIIDSSFEKISKAKDLVKAFSALGFDPELTRVRVRKIRSGRGKARGRKYVGKRGPLVVVSSQCEALRAVGSIPGIEACTVDQINASLLAPGAELGRATLYTQAAIERLEQEKLFTRSPVTKVQEPKAKKTAKPGKTKKAAKPKTAAKPKAAEKPAAKSAAKTEKQGERR